MLIQRTLVRKILSALESGLPNLLRHLENLNKFGLSTVVAINRFPTDSEKEIEKVQQVCSENGVNAVLAEHWTDGGKGASKLAETVIENIESKKSSLKFLYNDNENLKRKLKKLLSRFTEPQMFHFHLRLKKNLKEISELGYDNFPSLYGKDSI